MKISFIDIQNFRKLQNCRIHLSDKETLLVGANNSGKTSATDVLITFLDQSIKRPFSVTDFTLSNWKIINEYAMSWISDINEIQGNSIVAWQKFCPSIDVWLNANVNEVDKVAHLIPSLKWNGEPLGVRLILQPKDLDNLKIQFVNEFKNAEKVMKMSPSGKLSLWPRDIKDYLSKGKLNSQFEIRAYILDPLKSASPQELREEQSPMEVSLFNGIFKVDVIEAQRGFTDPNSSENKQINGGLSGQLKKYYDHHLNPTDIPDIADLKALESIDKAKELFDDKLNLSFKEALNEIKTLGYPGFNDPDIKLSSRINPIDSLDHDAAIIFDTQKGGFTGLDNFSLPEKYNGLGYKNLIYIVFKLISFRDQWLRKGKAQKRRNSEDIAIEPIHLVLIEEPEAHLHAQVQQVFIRKAYDVLRSGVNQKLTTQMIVSSHSSYIAHEAGFEKLRYFKRKPALVLDQVATAEVVDLSTVFKSNSIKTDDATDTAKFVSRYLKTIHCDLFFANGIIIVEGAAERMLIPHFIRTHYKDSLNQNYLSILEVGGAHAQRLRPLIDALSLPTLVITDTDATKLENNKSVKTRPEKGKKYGFGSDTLKDWFDLKSKTLDEVLELDDMDKVKGTVRVAYQCEISVSYGEGNKEAEVIPYTFEDALVLSNVELFKKLGKSTGMVKKMHLAFNKPNLDECCQQLYEELSGSKAQMALDLLFDVEPEALCIPKYIEEGFEWLKQELNLATSDFIDTDDGSDVEVKGAD
jgi:predicted ATP-dependent endonuclease of OLD family